MALGILLVGIPRELLKKRKPKHPDSADVQFLPGEAFSVRMGGRIAVVDCERNGSWRIHLSSVDRWQKPHQSDPFTEDDKQAIKVKLKNVFEAEGSTVTFK